MSAVSQVSMSSLLSILLSIPSPTTLLILILAVSHVAHAAHNPDANHADALIEWVRSKGGFFSDKLEIRRMDPEDESTQFGIFAKVDTNIEIEERLMEIPQQCYLRLEPDEVYPDIEDSENADMESTMKVYFGNSCQLAHTLLDELKTYRETPERSDYAPYLAYLETQGRGQIPTAYSQDGKALLRAVLGPISSTAAASSPSKNYGNYVLPPWQCVDWVDENFMKADCFSSGQGEYDPWEEHAVAMVIQRGFDHELIPIWDMVNHDNGNKMNTGTNSLRSEEGIKVWASKPIHAGEEIFMSYNYCIDCNDIGDEWGTPGLYRDFGFVEDYPQNWPLLDHDIYFRVVRNEETDRIEAVFDKEENAQVTYGVPDEKGLEFLSDQLYRLTEMNMDIKDAEFLLPPHEWGTINSFYQATVVALTSCIQATVFHNMHHLEEDQRAA